MSTPSTERAALADELFALIAKSQTQMLNVTDRITIGSAAGELRRCDGPNDEADHLRMQIGYIVAQLMIAGDKRSLPEIVEEAAKATRPNATVERVK